jgi:hypothetical protein
MIRGRQPIYSLEKVRSANRVSLGHCWWLCNGSLSAIAFSVLRIARANEGGQLSDARIANRCEGTSLERIGEINAGPPELISHYLCLMCIADQNIELLAPPSSGVHQGFLRLTLG